MRACCGTVVSCVDPDTVGMSVVQGRAAPQVAHGHVLTTPVTVDGWERTARMDRSEDLKVTNHLSPSGGAERWFPNEHSIIDPPCPPMSGYARELVSGRAVVASLACLLSVWLVWCWRGCVCRRRRAGAFHPARGQDVGCGHLLLRCWGVHPHRRVVVAVGRLQPAGRRRWRRGFYVFVVYGLVLEPLQAFRGLDPRFTEEGNEVDVVAGIVFGLTALFNTVLFVILGLRFFRSDVMADRATMRLGIRYGAVAVALSFAVGIVMSVNSGRHIGDDGNLLLSHGLGVHGIQAIPLVALLVLRPGPHHRRRGGCMPPGSAGSPPAPPPSSRPCSATPRWRPRP